MEWRERPVLFLLTWAGIALSSFGYLAGIKKWVYQGHMRWGLISVLVFFPLLITTTMAFPAYYLRSLPLVGVGMFVHHYGRRLLNQIKLLLFTTLTILVVQAYYMVYARFFLGQ